MRWLVEVSRVSDGSPTERYCIDARRWQSALQEVRRLRGDEGPLPKLTIELLDAGYRAVDPELKVRYIVSEAPPDMPVTAGAQVRHSTQPPPADSNGGVALPAAKAPFAVRGVAAAPSIPAPVFAVGSGQRVARFGSFTRTARRAAHSPARRVADVREPHSLSRDRACGETRREPGQRRSAHAGEARTGTYESRRW